MYKLAVSLVALIIALVVAELGLRLLTPMQLGFEYKDEQSTHPREFVRDETRNRLAAEYIAEFLLSLERQHESQEHDTGLSAPDNDPPSHQPHPGGPPPAKPNCSRGHGHIE